MPEYENLKFIQIAHWCGDLDLRKLTTFPSGFLAAKLLFLLSQSQNLWKWKSFEAILIYFGIKEFEQKVNCLFWRGLMLIFVLMKILAMKVESFDAGESFDGPSSSIAQTISQYQPNINSNTKMNLKFITILDEI